MADNASRRGAANVGMIIMLVAFVVMAGFLYWLNLQARKQKAVEVREDSVAQAANAADSVAASRATFITPSDLQNSAGQYAGQLVRVRDVKVASQLGKQGFWIGLPSGSPFLVSLTDSLRQQGVSVATGSTVTVVGTMTAMTDSVSKAWVASGTITKADQAAAGFAQFFIAATSVLTSGSSGSGGS